ncbi:CotH kinase family protein [Candidatus Saccharibacteria bacterium]|nr:CotH kinase family protein [Candidatus Saccharibacteria bacterium]MBR3353062.1 CotH kinase family protein [Candidatus Saccharibacteria bacterium]
MRKVDWILTTVFVLVVGGLGTMIWFLLGGNGQSSEYEYGGVPIIDISLNNVSVEQIDEGSKETKYYGNKVTIYNSDEAESFTNVEIKGRGNGTWIQKKKPYRIKFEEKIDLFGMGKAKTWCLLANALDDTKLRTETAFRLAKMLEMEYSVEGRFVELYMDGEYRGLYYLTHEMGIGKSGVNLKDPLGVLVELDNLYWANEKYYTTLNDDKLVAKDAVVDDNAELAMELFLEKFNLLEAAIQEKDFAKIEELADVESFAKYYLLSEFIVNPDAYWTSFYFYMDGAKDKIHAGPGWDFDLAFANRKWGNWLGDRFYSPTETMIRREELMSEEEYVKRGLDNWVSSGWALAKIMFNLMEVPEFQDEVERVFNACLLGKKEEIINGVMTSADKIEGLVKKDEEKWGEEGFREEVNTMVEWISQRYDYIESIYKISN